jgi:hypothetical protein
MGWVMLFIGLLLPVPVGMWLIGKRSANVVLTLLGLISLPLLVWSSSLALKIGPCKVDGCMSSSEHSRLVLSLPALALVLIAFGLLAYHQVLPGAAALIVGLILGAISVTKTDTTVEISYAILAGFVALYVVYMSYGDEASRVPDFPPPT